MKTDEMVFASKRTHQQVLNLTLVVVMLLSLFGTTGSVPRMAENKSSFANAFVEPSLYSENSKTVSVIVTAADSQSAAQAVTAVGGTATSDLWLINAVAATLPSDAVSKLAKIYGVKSIVHNKNIVSSNSSDCDPNQGPCSSKPGWVSDRYVKTGQFLLAEKQTAPIVKLPDGGFVAVAEKNAVTFLNPDGSIRSSVQAVFENAKNAPLVGQDGSIYFTGTTTINITKVATVFALNPNGSLKWSFTKDTLLPGGITLDEPRGYVYALATDATIYLLNINTGSKIKDIKGYTDKPGLVTVAPFLDSNGMLYVQTSGVKPQLSGLKGNLVALNPSLFVDSRYKYTWRFITPKISGSLNYVSLDYSPVVLNGTIFITSKKENKVFGVDAADGQILFTINLPTSVELQPVKGPNDSLLVTAGEYLFKLSPSGTILFQIRPIMGSKITSVPAISKDGSALYLGIKKDLFALSASNGTMLWKHSFEDEILDMPLVALSGDLIAGSKKNLAVFSADGSVNSSLLLDDDLHLANSRMIQDNTFLVVGGDKKLIKLTPISNSLVQAASTGQDPSQANSHPSTNVIGIDIGADKLHETILANGEPIQGQGVTIAVVDSGVFMDDHGKGCVGKLHQGSLPWPGGFHPGGHLPVWWHPI